MIMGIIGFALLSCRGRLRTMAHEDTAVPLYPPGLAPATALPMSTRRAMDMERDFSYNWQRFAVQPQAFIGYVAAPRTGGLMRALRSMVCAVLLAVGLVAMGGSGVAQAGTVRTFEGEPVGQPPTGTRTYGTVTVQDVAVGGATTRAVRVVDTSTTSMSRALFLQGSTPARQYDFDLLPRAATQATLIAVHGNGASENTGAWRFMIVPQSSTSTTANVSVYNGSSWVSLGSVAGLADRNGWSHIRIEASTTTVSITARGTRFTTAVKAAPATYITSLEVASSGTAVTGTDSYVDNLEMNNTGFVVATEPSGYEPRFPDVVKLPDGRLLAVYHSATGHTKANGTIKMTLSSNSGATWTTPVLAVSNAYDNRDPKVAVLSDGSVLLNFFQDQWHADGTYTNRGLWVARMPAGASGFSTPTKVATATGFGFSHGPVVEIPGGDVLLPYYNNGARVIRSHDRGSTWDTASDKLIAGTSATRSYVEPNITRLPAGQLVMSIRTVDRSTNKETFMTLTRSNDNGVTWSSLETTGFVTSSHHALATSSGAVLLTYGNSLVTNRPTYGTLIDNPAGSWSASTFPPRFLYDSRYSDQANPSTVEISPGRYLTLAYNVGTRQLLAYVTTTATY